MTRELRAASTSYWAHGFLRVRLLERLGLVDINADDTYVLAMVSALGPDKSEKLRADPDLIERALWRVFEVEGGGEVSLTNVDRFGGDEWRKTFLELTSDGTLDRARVLNGCLHALGRDFAAYRASWYSATYLALEPTAEETASSQSDLRRLLRAAVPATVAFSLKQLARVQKAGLLDVEPTLEALPPATLVKAKGTAIAAPSGPRRTFRVPGRRRSSGPAALGHPHPDVQRAAATLLADLGEGDAVLAAAEDLTPSVRHELGLHAEAGQDHQSPHGQGLAPAPAGLATDLAERAAALLEDASNVGELEAVLACLVTAGPQKRLEP